MELWNLTFPSYGALNGVDTFLFSTGQIFCQKRLYHIEAMIVLKRFGILRMLPWLVLYENASFKTNNILYSLENQIWDKTK